MFANGGVQSTQGSAMAANGLNLQIVRQDDTSKMQADLRSQQLAHCHANKKPRQVIGGAFLTVSFRGLEAV